MNERIILEHVSKKYGSRWVLRDVQEAFYEGESVALMGHNGCGKSTLLKIAAGLISPSEGRVRCQKPLRFSYVPEKVPAAALTAGDYLKRMGEIDGIPKGELERRIQTLADEFFAGEMLHLPMRKLSKGTLQKMGVIQALLVPCDVLLLDEPLSGQDEASQAVFVRKVKERKAENTTVLMSCHEQWLADAISDRVMTIDHGALIPVRGKKEKMYYLYVEARGDAEPVPAAGMKPLGSGYVVRASESESQEMILRLLQTGWQLKGMYDEDCKFSKVSASDLF